MGAVVGGVAALDPEVHRHGTIACDSEDIQQLLEVGAVVLVVAVGDGQAKLSPEGPLLVGRLVVAVERDGGGVVVQFVEIDAELTDGVCHNRERERRDVGVEEPVEATSDAVVVERRELRCSQSQQLGRMACGPLADAVERLARDQEILDQDHQPGRGGDA
jgi:hypothetical protein